MQQENKIAFISGHLDLTQDEFDRYYRSMIRNAVDRGHSFVVGDANGVDTMAQELLEFCVCQKRVTVFHMFDLPRNYKSILFNKIGGFSSDKERDEAMTLASNYDITWVKPGRQNSGTAKNLKRRYQFKEERLNALLNKEAIYLSDIEPDLKIDLMKFIVGETLSANSDEEIRIGKTLFRAWLSKLRKEGFDKPWERF